jgi:GxxExxY protein
MPQIHGDEAEELFPLKEETHEIIGICMEVHRNLGKGFLEIVYKDAIEYELRTKNILYEREKEYSIKYKDIILPHKFFADFVIFGSVIIEIKAQKHLIDDHYHQMINYLAVSGCKIGLLFNFGESSLKFKRIIF